MRKTLHLKANNTLHITLNKNALRIIRRGGPSQWIPLTQVRQIILHGPVKMNASIFYHCLTEGIPIVCLSHKKQQKGFMIPAQLTNQHDQFSDKLDYVLNDWHTYDVLNNWLSCKASHYWQKALKHYLNRSENYRFQVAKSFLEYTMDQEEKKLGSSQKTRCIFQALVKGDIIQQLKKNIPSPKLMQSIYHELMTNLSELVFILTIPCYLQAIKHFANTPYHDTEMPLLSCFTQYEAQIQSRCIYVMHQLNCYIDEVINEPTYF